MPTMSTGLKAKLTISPCAVNNGLIRVTSSPAPFEAMINPTGYTQKSTVEYTKVRALGAPGSEPKYSATPAEKYTLESFILDGTGVVSVTGLVAVKDQVASLREVVYSYVGTEHETPIVQVSWGPLLFYARVSSMDVQYTLFKPSGEPLRAKVTMSFVEYQSVEEISKEANQSSPDLTHLIQVKAGDTLPLLCYRIYKDCSYYLEIARINKLTNFRQLQPGQVLSFPPLQ